ncbi:MAG: membrane fusion protein (multidrug efflux system), partial [Polaribacter sp.]
MKNIYLILLTALILTSCEGKKATSVVAILATNDLAQIKSKKAALDEEKQALSAELKQLNDRLDALNEDKNIPLITTFKVEETVFTHFIELQGNVQTCLL